MAHRQLWLFVEGNDDQRFFGSEKIQSVLKRHYDYVRIWKYAQEKPEKIKGFLNSLKVMSNTSYLFVTDINNSPCITHRKTKKREAGGYGQDLEEEKIIVVVKEIESWYLAGLNEKDSKQLKIKSFRNTSQVTKEKFERSKPKKFDSTIDFMQEILKYFSIETAKNKNASFRYFMDRLSGIGKQ